MAKSYSQYCPVAHALDVVGERWSLLIVRELLHGPLRYTDLQERLPGIGTNILACRLRDLETHGVLSRRKLPPPTPVAVYELTVSGRALHPVLHQLAHWGARSLERPDADYVAEPGWLEHALRLAISLSAPQGTFVFHVGDEIASLVDGEAAPGAAPDPDVVVRTDPPGFYDLFVQRRFDAVEVDGDAALLERLVVEADFRSDLAPAAAAATV
jgi:DNA-binding HxlR family transcriptional regulator